MTTRKIIVGLVLNYRDAKRTILCAESLLSQGINWVLVWDNSDDEGRGVAEVTAHFADNPRVHIHLSDRNLGFSAGVNAGLLFCLRWFPEAWVLLINNDAYLLPDGMQKLYEALSNNPLARIAFPNINHCGTVLGRAFYQPWTGRLSWTPCAGSFPYASGCCMMIAVDRIDYPLFDEEFFMYGEDCELGWRLRGQPESLLHIPETLVKHEGAGSSGLGSFFYEEHMVAAHLILVRKIAGNNRWKSNFMYSIRSLMLVSRAIVRCVRFRSLVPMRALWSGYRIAFCI